MTTKVKHDEPENALLASLAPQTVNEYIWAYYRRVRSGDIGALPIIFGMVIIAIIFQSANSNFLNPKNLVNLIVQMSAITTIGYGIVFVLLLGEIDLSVGFVSGTAAVSMTLALKNPLNSEMATSIAVFFALSLTYFIWYALLKRVRGKVVDAQIPALFLLVPILALEILLLVYTHTAQNPEAAPRPWSWWEFIPLIATGVFTAYMYRAKVTVRFLLGLIVYAIVLLLARDLLMTRALVWYEAVFLALVSAAGIGLLHGTIITFFGLPAFVVTLAGLLAWQGVVLIFIGGAGTVILQDQTILGVANTFLPPELGWLVALAFVGAFGISGFLEAVRRQRLGLSFTPFIIIGAQTLLLSGLAAVAVWICNQDRGVPMIGVGLILMMIGLSFLATRTRFGRYVFAVGGNTEAARRAGINVEQIRVRVFMISSLMAGVGGIILASRLRSVDTNAGGGQILLNSIAAAVIGGTSLFGGSGKVASALMGAVIIASVDNGMGLLGLSAGAKFIITALVLLAAVVVDALARRSQKQSGIR